MTGWGGKPSFLMILHRSIIQLMIQHQLFLQTTSHCSGIQPSLDVIQKLVVGKTRLLVVNHPANWNKQDNLVLPQTAKEE